MHTPFLRAASAVLAAGLLAGCASSYRIDATVQSFAALPTLPPAPTYRLERLPSQAADAQQARVEALADPALLRAGLRRDDAAPRYAVQVSARLQRVVAVSPFGWGGPGFGWGGWWGPPIATAANTAYRREVDLVLRELPANRVVFESRASEESFYLDSDEVLGALFDAALAGFPSPPPGPRRVVVPVRPVAQPVPPAAPAR